MKIIKWEYLVLVEKDCTAITIGAVLAKNGDFGWEFTSFLRSQKSPDHVLLVFKRPFQLRDRDAILGSEATLESDLTD